MTLKKKLFVFSSAGFEHKPLVLCSSNLIA